MKENKYDDPVFFRKYSQMSRSQHGLAGAGEWQTFRKLLPDFTDRDVLDLGCGYGWHCKYAAEHGARSVLGIDISQRMLDTAIEKNSDSRICYRQSAMEDLDFPDGSFQVIFSSLAFHYVADFEGLMERIGRWIAPGGDLVFSVEHPVFTAYGSQDWYYDENGSILHFPVDNYFFEGRREAVFLGEKVTKYHRTLTTYMNALRQNGFLIRDLAEPMPPFDMMEIPGMKDEMRRPMMLLIAAWKTEN